MLMKSYCVSVLGAYASSFRLLMLVMVYLIFYC